MGSIAKRKKAGGATYYVAWVRRRPYKPATKSFETKLEAQTWVRELEDQLKPTGRTSRPDATTVTIGDLAREFLEDPEVMGKRYYASLEQLLGWWVYHYKAKKLIAISSSILREARGKLLEDKKPATVNRHLAALRSAYNWAKSQEIIPPQYSWPRKILLTEPKGRERYLTDDELAALMAAAAKHSKLMHAAVSMLIGCGLRASELLRLKWDDVDLVGGRARVLLTKNNESRAVHIPAPVAATVDALPRVSAYVTGEEADKPLTLDALESRWRKVRTAADLKDFRMHDLRHSCASFLAQNGANLLQIGAVLGHKSAQMTKRYAHLVQGEAVTGHAALGEKLKAR